MPPNRINVGLVGLGTVGRGTVEILHQKRKHLEKVTGADICLLKVADRSPENKKIPGLPAGPVAKDYRTVISHPDIHIVVELVGGTTEAFDIIAGALKNGKHVVTANKAVLAEHGDELFALARAHGRAIGFEAAVCGGIPVIRALREGLVANRILSIFGILNGTANFILSKMRFDGMGFKAALHEAQRLGFAEKDPTFDIEGTDSAHKIALLASIAFGQFYSYRDIPVEGIARLTRLDMRYAREIGYVIKLLAGARMGGGGSPYIFVAPALIPLGEILAEVNYEYNGAFIEGDAVGYTLFTGKGAGGLPTASAVVSDLVDIAGKGPGAAQSFRMFTQEGRGTVRPVGDLESEYYLRLTVADRPGVMAKISGVLGDHGVSIKNLMQKQNRAKGHAIIIITTHRIFARHLTEAVRIINGLDIVYKEAVKIRIIGDLYQST